MNRSLGFQSNRSLFLLFAVSIHVIYMLGKEFGNCSCMLCGEDPIVAFLCELCGSLEGNLTSIVAPVFY